MTSISVQPIAVGFDTSLTISFQKQGGGAPDGFDLTTATRIYGCVRSAPGQATPVLTTFDSAASPATIQVIDATTLKAIVKAAASKDIKGTSVRFDFARQDNGIWTLIPVLFTWPVITPTTLAPP